MIRNVPLELMNCEIRGLVGGKSDRHWALCRLGVCMGWCVDIVMHKNCGFLGEYRERER